MTRRDLTPARSLADDMAALAGAVAVAAQAVATAIDAVAGVIALVRELQEKRLRGLSDD